MTALHHASSLDQLQVVQALVVASANPAARNGRGSTPLIEASIKGHTDVVAFLMRLPAVKASVDAITIDRQIALSCASRNGRWSIVQLLLDAGADPSFPPGERSPLRQAVRNNRHAVAALLRGAIAEPERARDLHKVRSLLGAGAASLACLQGRVEQGQALPWVEPVTPQQQQQQQQGVDDGEGRETLRATAAFAVGVSGGEKDSGLCDELYKELMGYMPPAWADRGSKSRKPIC